MIRYALKCANDHDFESWFQSAEAFDKLQAAGLLSCTICGSGEVRKCLMAPSVAATETKPPATPPAPTPQQEQQQAITALREQIEANSDYVGRDFADEARQIHSGTAPERAIHGEANLSEAKELIDDGIPIAPLPFIPTRKTN